jgi:PAS domain S-box-containing protein
MSFDIHSIYVTVSILCCLTALFLFFSQSREFGRNGELEWTIGQFCHGLAWGLLGLRGIIPDFYSIVLANSFLTASYGLFHGAINKFDGRTYRGYLLFLPSVVTFLFFSFSWLFVESVFPRALYIVLVSCVQLAFIAAALLRGTSVPISRFRRFTGCLFILAALLWLARLLEVIFYPHQGTQVFEANAIQLPILILGGGLTILSSLGFLLIIRERTEQLIQAQAESLQKIINNAPLIMMLVDRDGHVLRVNAGFDPPSRPGAGPSSNRLCGDVLRCLHAFEKSGCGKTPHCLTCTIRNTFEETFSTHRSLHKKEGIMTVQKENEIETRHVLVSTTHLDLPDESVLISIYDITDQKNAEEALRESEERYRMVVSSAREGIILQDNRGNILTWNGAAEEIFGISAAEALKHTSMSRDWNTYGEDGSELKGHDHPSLRTLATGEPCQNVVMKIVRDTGEFSWVNVNTNPIFKTDEQKPSAVVITFSDITKRKQAEERLRESEAKLRAIFDTVGTGILIIDRETQVIIEANQAAKDMSGIAGEEIVGRTCHALICTDQNGSCPIQDPGRRVDHTECKLFCADGQQKDILKTLYPITIQGRECCLAAFVDIADRKRAEAEKAKLQEQLLQSQKMEFVGRLAGGVAHDFNNMLGVILGHAEIALEQADPAQQLRADLQEIQKAAQRSIDLTRQLLAFARKQTASPRVLDVNETVARMLKMLQRLIGEDIRLAWLPGANLWPVKIDPSQIDQILANLSVNARDAIAGVGKVVIATENVTFDELFCTDHADFVPGEYVLLAVSDNGCGMGKEILDKLFEPYFTTKETGKGTGLGLATVYGIVKQNNGFINVLSAPNQGTTLNIYLPRHAGIVEGTQKDEPQEASMVGRETLLLVEDEKALLHLSKRILEKKGYHVLTAETPDEAIRQAAQHAGQIHLLITDVVMPGMNGRDLARKMGSLYPGIRILFMSGYTADVIAHHGVLDEGVHFIQKPFSRMDLASKVREVLAQT